MRPGIRRSSRLRRARRMGLVTVSSSFTSECSVRYRVRAWKREKIVAACRNTYCRSGTLAVARSRTVSPKLMRYETDPKIDRMSLGQSVLTRERNRGSRRLHLGGRPKAGGLGAAMGAHGG